MTLERAAATLGIAATLASGLVAFGVQLAKLESLGRTVEEIRQEQREIMKAIGTIEHDRWRQHQGGRGD